MSKYYEKEARVRKILSEQLKINIVKKKLVYVHDKSGQPKEHEFDLVANTENGLLVGEVKSSSYSNQSRYQTTKFWRVLGACIFLEKVEASRKILVLTEKEFFEHFKVDSEGLISEDIEIMLVEVRLPKKAVTKDVEARTKSLKKHHRWTEEDDIVTFYLYKFGEKDIPFSLEDVGEKLGMGVSSLRMRIANFKAIDGRGGLGHFGGQSLKIYERYKETSESELKSLVLKIIKKA